jgi:L-alanine-DL-glutamate epimerase-like enolase superfamily enzyme
VGSRRPLLSQPLWRLLGGFRTELPAYVSTVTFATAAEYLDVAEQCIKLGYDAVKLHGWGDPRADAGLCQAVRDLVGDAVPLMYDGSAGFDLPDAVYLGHALADVGYFWYEEPMREFSVPAYRALSAVARVPLLVAETSDGAHMSYESLITSSPVRRAPEVDADGMLKAPPSPGIGLSPDLDYPATLIEYVTPAPEDAGATHSPTAQRERLPNVQDQFPKCATT